jgi:hypothetical protein
MFYLQGCSPGGGLVAANHMPWARAIAVADFFAMSAKWAEKLWNRSPTRWLYPAGSRNLGKD